MDVTFTIDNINQDVSLVGWIAASDLASALQRLVASRAGYLGAKIVHASYRFFGRRAPPGELPRFFGFG